jgi:3-oxoacyl-[acyl-carrier-protein] synthase II
VKTVEDKGVVITGAGPVSAIGIGREAFMDGVRRYRSGIGQFAAEISDFSVVDYLETEKAYLDRASQLAFAAMSLSIEDANLDLKNMDRSSMGLILGSATGCLASTQLFFNDYLEKGPRFVKPILFPHAYANTTISLLAIEYGLNGYHLNFSSGATSSSGALLHAYDMVRTGRCALAFAGGFEALSPMLLRGTALNDDQQGFMPGEGAGIVVLENAAHARQRGAVVLGEILGGGMTGGDILKAMHLACSSLAKRDDAVTGFSLATPGGDLDPAEMAAIMEFQGDRPERMPVNRLKAILGETAGADTALRVIAALHAISPGVTLVNSIDPGGNVVCLAVRGMNSGT